MKLQITVEGRAYAVDVELIEDEPAAEDLTPLPPPMPPAAMMQSYPVTEASDPKICRSPVMGLVIKVNVEPGQSIAAGELMLVLEAMKMETNVVAQAAATVKTVHVRPGEPVKLNQPLVEFE